MTNAARFARQPAPWLGLTASDTVLVGMATLVATGLLHPVDAAFAGVWAVAIAIVVRSDLRAFIIPNAASAAIAGLGATALLTSSYDPQDAAGSLLNAALDAAIRSGVGFGFFWLTARIYILRSGREGLGFGDVKLAGASGLWLSIGSQVIALEIACLAALVAAMWWRRQGRVGPLPFGAFLAPAAWLVFVVKPTLNEHWPF